MTSSRSPARRATTRRPHGSRASSGAGVLLGLLGLFAVGIAGAYLLTSPRSTEERKDQAPARTGQQGKLAKGDAKAAAAAATSTEFTGGPGAVGREMKPDARGDSQASGDRYPREIASGLELQVELSRRGFSCGSIDGTPSLQTIAALRAFQEGGGLEITGVLNAETRQHLRLLSPALGQRAIQADDLARLGPLSPTWLGKSQQGVLAHETLLELVAERYHAHPALLTQLNPTVNWAAVTADSMLVVPMVERTTPATKAARVRIRLAERVLDAFDAEGNVLLHFPVSIAKDVEKRPVGELHVTVVIPEPNYTFNPAVFPESAEAQEIGRILVLPPGPNNPVGRAWIGLDRPGYGVHGTPVPEQVGRTESHGCFRLANWDALALIELAWVGMPVTVEP